ncbi:deazaflavin-dependent oxidoreductase, nitroreductase family [Actinokineospora alba]|uniref:Deazaflavin-dependent oxidoreductase, nitroreductase family n=1 Tax=Actinokineospora alba TaxID=504798 RepID=A0A1H0VP81_9PSEU|nr:nitroreductase/quinone reductase family protein [Actinokineospora alba]TDP70190.1 deazaflavin-dependent oxidoreductase (nitroreductase family) [Actinokineospora alba]SDI37135.1 deazaflavin-dependent oxidoreductase, nitroreductase family [Actinokineospora alba]SDP80327.1 deazaflavin-dependent oxidoreductase, nitroreductase family [Actinokineospora alba]
MPNPFNQRVIDEFRANSGQVGGEFEGSRLLLLTTTGARTGARHTTPVSYLPDGGDRVLVIASASGSSKHPHWYTNLVADPLVQVEDGVFTYEARATVLTGAERDDAYARAAEDDPEWADYQAKTDRVIPVVALEQVSGGPPNGATFGEALKRVHGGFRRELALIRAEIAKSGPRLGAQLRVNCLTMCHGLSIHHSHEDQGMFSALEAGHPELVETLDRLRAEHVKIAALLADLQQVISTEGADTQVVLAEVERLTGELERHLDYEEEQLIPVIDGVA